MKSFVYYAPTKIYFGKGRENEVGQVCSNYGYKKVFIVYGGQSAIKSGLLNRVEDSLKNAGIAFGKAGGVKANPRLSRTREILKDAIEFGPDFILAVGGGSVIDTAKTVAYGVAKPEIDVWDYFIGKEKITAAVPVGAILTIAAAGSEMSDSCVQTNDTVEPPQKFGTGSEFNRCKFAILNPELTYTLPKYQIGSGVADIFMHTEERYFATADKTGNHLSDEYAEGLMRDIIHYGLIGVNNPTDYEAMSEIMWCSSLSHCDITGLGLDPNNRGGDWAVHQLGQAMSAVYDVAHGASLTAVWGSWARYCLDANPARFVQFGKKVWGLEGSDEAVIEEAIKKTEEWFVELGMPINITDLLGKTVTEEDVKKLALVTTRDKARTIGQLKVIDNDMVEDLFRMSR